MADLPVRLIYVIGMPSGGTSCVAGILFTNGFWSPYWRQGHESKESYNALNIEGQGIFSVPRKKPNMKAVKHAESIFFQYKADAIKNGYDKAVMKAPGLPIWCDYIFTHSRVKVEPLLVWRNPIHNAQSMKKHFPFLVDKKVTVTPEFLAERGQNEILNLHKKHGWPLWKFGKNSDIKVLEKLLNVALPLPYFNKDRIVSGG